MQEINFYIAPVHLVGERERERIMSSQRIVPNRNLRRQRLEQVGEEGNRSPHVQPQQNLTYVVPMPPDYEVTELTWENGQLGLHGINLPPPTKHHHPQSWPAKPRDTLESIVHQVTFPQPSTTAGKYFPAENNNNTTADENWEFENAAKVDPNFNPTTSSGGQWKEKNTAHAVRLANSNNHINIPKQRGGKLMMMMSSNNMGNAATSGGGKWSENSGAGLGNKRVRSESERSGCASAAICGEATTMMTPTWGSFESPGSTNLKRSMNTDDDSAYNDQDCSENQDGERMTKGESFRSQSSARRSRVAAIHNLSERRRRDRINEKMKALQKLVPNASKTDKASMLDEVIEFLKQLQAQVHMMSNARNMPQMMMPLGMQQQIQMSFLARMGMGMGMGMGMLDVNNMARNVPRSFSPLIHTTTPLGGTTTSFISPSFAMPPVVPFPPQLKSNIGAANINSSVPSFNDAYNTFISQQSMNMEFLNKMSALYRQQVSQPSKKPISSSLPNDGQGE